MLPFVNSLFKLETLLFVCFSACSAFVFYVPTPSAAVLKFILRYATLSYVFHGNLVKSCDFRSQFSSDNLQTFISPLTIF